MIENRFLYFQTYSDFKNKLNAGQINENSIAFIEDLSLIWTHGNEFGNSTPINLNEEDLAIVNDKIQFADKDFDPSVFSGLGRKYLRKNIVSHRGDDSSSDDSSSNDSEQLSESTDFINLLDDTMINMPNTVYVIQYDYDLDGTILAIPENCVLRFDGGSISNGTLIGQNTLVVYGKHKDECFKNVQLLGTWASNDGPDLPIYAGSGDSSLKLNATNNVASGANSVAEGHQSQAIGFASHAEGHGTSATGDYSHAEGYDTITLGKFSHAEGYKTKTQVDTAHAEGNETLASGLAAHAEGGSTKASANQAHAEGGQTKATANNAHAEGYQTTASGANAHAENSGSIASGNNSHAEGYQTKAEGARAHSEGFVTKATGENSHAEGGDTTASGSHSHAEGMLTGASGLQSHAEGYRTKATESNAHAEGNTSKATANGAHAEGYMTEATGAQSHAEGRKTKATGNGSHAEGYCSDATDAVLEATGKGAHAEGYNTQATGNGAHAEGFLTIANGDGQHVEGVGNFPISAATHIIGDGYVSDDSIIEEDRSNAEVTIGRLKYINGIGGYSGREIGNAKAVQQVVADIEERLNLSEESISIIEGKIPNQASSTNQLADKNFVNSSISSEIANMPVTKGEGTNSLIQKNSDASNANKATNNNAIATGYKTSASGVASHSEGNSTIAYGDYAHAEGEGAMAHGQGAHAEGKSSNPLPDGTIAQNIETKWGTTKFGEAWGLYSHVEGQDCLAKGDHSHAEGTSNYAGENSSHAEGNGTNATNPYEHAEGQYNKSNTGTRHSVGIGTGSNARKNAFEIMSDGKAFFYNVGGYNGTNPTNAESVQTVINALINSSKSYTLNLNESGTPFSEFIGYINTSSVADLNDSEFLPFILDVAKNSNKPKLMVKSSGANNYNLSEIDYQVTFPINPASDFDITFTFANQFEETAPIGGQNYKVVRAEISLNDDEITSITVTGIQ